STLAAGSYAFRAHYNGDDNYAASTGPCEPFTVNQGTSQTATLVYNASTNAAWAGTEQTGASAYDTSTVTGSDTITPTGSVTYTFFPTGTCADNTGASAGTKDLPASCPTPRSSDLSTLAAGSYAFRAHYNGDDNYAASTGPCEPFTVNQGTSRTATVVYNGSTSAAWAGSE